MRLGDIDHITIPVSNLERSLKFYVGILGLNQLPKPDYLRRGAWLAGEGGRPRINLTTKTPPKPECGGRLEPTDRHLAFLVDDYEKAKSLLESHGIATHEIQHRSDTPRELFFVDPDGHLLEIRSALWPG